MKPSAAQSQTGAALGATVPQWAARDNARERGVGECVSDKESAMKNLLKKLVKDEQGGEVLEYALIAGLIVVAAIAVITTVGEKVLAKWEGVDAGLTEKQ
jgi:Flp pilus assembly pilin Flp